LRREGARDRRRIAALGVVDSFALVVSADHFFALPPTTACNVNRAPRVVFFFGSAC